MSVLLYSLAVWLGWVCPTPPTEYRTLPIGPPRIVVLPGDPPPAEHQ